MNSDSLNDSITNHYGTLRLKTKTNFNNIDNHDNYASFTRSSEIISNKYEINKTLNDHKQQEQYSHTESDSNINDEIDINVNNQQKVIIRNKFNEPSSVLYPTNNLTIRALSFRNKTFSVTNKQTNETAEKKENNFNRLQGKTEDDKYGSYKTSIPNGVNNKLNENTISNLLSNRPVPPTRTISLKQAYESKSSSIRQRNFNYPRLHSDLYIPNANTCTDQDVVKVESCYKSMGTNVFACKTIADLYSTNIKDLMDLSDWNHQCSGIPIWIFNTGINPKRRKCLTFVLADRLTGFALRRIESVTYVNDFKWAKKNLITFKVSNEFNQYLNVTQDINSLDRKKLHSAKSNASLKSLDKVKIYNERSLYALEFKNDFECSRFYDYYRSIAYDNSNKDLFDLNYKPKKSDNIIRVFCRRITKSAISAPCAFQHINSVPNLLTLLNEESSKSSTTEDNESISSSNTLTDDIGQMNLMNDENLYNKTSNNT